MPIRRDSANRSNQAKGEKRRQDRAMRIVALPPQNGRNASGPSLAARRHNKARWQNPALHSPFTRCGRGPSALRGQCEDAPERAMRIPVCCGSTTRHHSLMPVAIGACSFASRLRSSTAVLRCASSSHMVAMRLMNDTSFAAMNCDAEEVEKCFASRVRHRDHINTQKNKLKFSTVCTSQLA